MKILKNILVVLLVFSTIFFVIFSIYELSINPMDWGEISRDGLLFTSFSSTVLYLGLESLLKYY